MLFKSVLQPGLSWSRRCHLLGGARLLSVDVEVTRLGYSEYGDPSKVVSKVQERLSCSLQPGQVLAKYLLAPVNPADINVLQGTYPIRPPLPATGGGEGVAEVVAVGPPGDQQDQVDSLSPGDWVIPARPMVGTWRSHVLGDHRDWIRVRNDIPALGAATMLINPCTAYRMLRDFVELRPGDCVLQNGANSAVGQAVVQIARSMGVRTVNVVRDRENIGQLKQRLTQLGGDVVLTEQELRATKLFRSGELPRPVLGLNCVGGDSSAEMCKALGPGGVMVTYGGMSRKPVSLATSHLIFKQIQLHGFWMGQWNERQGRSEARLEMYRDISDMIAKEDLVPPKCQIVGLDRYAEVLDNTLRGYLPAKYVFEFDNK